MLALLYKYVYLSCMFFSMKLVRTVYLVFCIEYFVCFWSILQDAHGEFIRCRTHPCTYGRPGYRYGGLQNPQKFRVGYACECCNRMYARPQFFKGHIHTPGMILVARE